PASFARSVSKIMAHIVKRQIDNEPGVQMSQRERLMNRSVREYGKSIGYNGEGCTNFTSCQPSSWDGGNRLHDDACSRHHHGEHLCHQSILSHSNDRGKGYRCILSDPSFLSTCRGLSAIWLGHLTGHLHGQ